MADDPLARLASRRTDRWLIDAIDGADASKGAGRVDPGWFHPSDLSHPCDAFLAFRFLGAPSEFELTGRQQRIFDLGHARDKALKKSVKKAGVSLITKEAERKIVIPEYRIRGELDDWVENPLTHQRYIVDYKTMNKDAWEAQDSVKLDHHIQVHPYMFDKKTYKAYVVYENKNTQELKGKVADFDTKIWRQDIVDRTQRIINDIDNGFIHRMPIPNEASCPFYKICSYADINQLKVDSKLWQPTA